MRQLLNIVALGLLWAAPVAAQAKVNIFACEPEWAALAEEIGGDNVTAFSATHAKQDPHHIRARPSLIAKARHADLILCSGAGLEVGWLPLLIQKAGGHVQPGSLGYLMASEYVPILEKPIVVDRSMGDVHPEGNPHIHLNPHNILLVAQELTKRLETIDRQHAGFYQNQLNEFISRWQPAIARWENNAAPLKNLPVVVHHRGFSYLLDWLELRQVASLEPKPGIPPTAAHLEGLLQQLKAKPASMIIRTPYEPKEASEWLSEKIDRPAVMLPYTIGGDDESGNLFTLFDRSMSLLRGAVDDQ